MSKKLLQQSSLATLLVVVAPMAAQAAIVDNLLAWWEFEAVGPGHTIADLSGNGRNLTLYENPYLTNPLFPPPARPTIGAGGVGGGSALQYSAVPSPSPFFGLPSTQLQPAGFAAYPDANPSGVDSSDAIDFVGPIPGYSIQAWINVSQNSDHQIILSNRTPRLGIGGDLGRPGWDLVLYGTGGIPGNQNNLELQGYTNGVGSHQVSVGAVSTNSWHQILVTFSDATGIHMYFNGVDLITLPFNTSISTFALSPASLLLGTEEARAFGSTPYLGMPLQGSMDKVALWNRALTPDEVATLYNQGNGYNLPQEEGVPAPGALSLMLLGCATLIAAGRRRLV